MPPTVQEKLIQLVREYLPPGVLKKSDELLNLWIGSAAGEINRRRGKTTKKEASITLSEDETEYDLPDDCVEVKKLILEGCDSGGGGLSRSQFPLEFQGYGGMLPTGQRITPSIDLIHRQEASRNVREVVWRVESDKLVIDFQPEEGAIAKVMYVAEDLSVENIPERYYELVLVYLRMRSLEQFLEGVAVAQDHVGDRLVSMNIGEMNRALANLRGEWLNGIAKITSEVD